ncbi:hypothetical protein JYU34_016950 [Plutella xylostella]|uniref:Uncharacterized protein n=1 Tax=Plutella xylostella TaxID=51655 RepID=A0ABQ7Q5A1_PLUXY|nr:hypothetical protein JYU34_016950 [Plutella xylostella]
MLLNSITVRLNDMSTERFLSPLLGFFIDGLAAIVPCPKENIYVFCVQDDTDVHGSILNVSFSARRPEAEVGVGGDASPYYSPLHLRERVYLNRATLARLATVQVLPFDDNVCVHEPCLNYEECLTVLKFGNASGFVHSDTVLFRPIYPVTTFTCQCPHGITGSHDHYMCDTEVDLCYSSPCANGGSCLRREGGYTCVCAAGFTGCCKKKVDLCYSSPCANGGPCLRREGGYTCVCASGFTGTNCETVLTNATCSLNGEGTYCRGGAQCVARAEGGVLCQGCSLEPEYTTPACELKARSFPPHSALTFGGLKMRHRLSLSLRASSGVLCKGCSLEPEYTTPACELKARSFPPHSALTFNGLKMRHRLSLRLRFATQQSSGLLLYNGRYNERHDYIALELISSGAGRGGGAGLRFSFSLGGASTSVTVEADVASGEWHTVHVDYFNRVRILYSN